MGEPLPRTRPCRRRSDTSSTSSPPCTARLQLEYSDLVEPIEPLPDGRGRFSVHPLVRIHPDNGERILFFTPQFVKHFVGLTHRESAKLHDLLSEHVTGPN